MPRDATVHVEDMIQAVEKIISYTDGLSLDSFLKDEKTFDAVVRNLEILGEAAKQIPNDLREKYSAIEWRKITGLRDMLIHEYFGIDAEIIWDIITKKLPTLKVSLTSIRKELLR